MQFMKANSGKILFVVVVTFLSFLGYAMYLAPVSGLENKLVWLLREHGYIILFAWSILEGEIGLVMGGILCHTGDMNLFLAIFVAGLGGFAGDQIYFYTGRYNKSYIQTTGMYKSQKRKFAMAHVLLKKFGWPIIFVQRYMYGMRTIIPISIGLTRYSSKKFAFINLISAWCWATITIIPAWYFGDEILQILVFVKKHWYFAIPFGIAVAGGIYFYFHSITKRRINEY